MRIIAVIYTAINFFFFKTANYIFKVRLCQYVLSNWMSSSHFSYLFTFTEKSDCPACKQSLKPAINVALGQPVCYQSDISVIEYGQVGNYMHSTSDKTAKSV